jgi:predicted  nucleic acid-binding Zn-ribbon protein
MTRLEETLRNHELKLRMELNNAAKKRSELEEEMARLTLAIATTRADLADVRTELERRGCLQPEHEPAKDHVIAETDD